MPIEEFERYVARPQGYLHGEEVDRDGTPSRFDADAVSLAHAQSVTDDA